MKRIYVIILLVIILAMGLSLGYFIGQYKMRGSINGALNIIHPIRENNPSYKFINPLLAYIIPSTDEQNNFGAIKNKIEYFIDSEKNKGNIYDTSVFISDLNKGRWIGVNENQKYNPASMLKVVIMVVYFKDEEQNKNILSKKLTYSQSLDQLLRKDSFNVQSNLEINKSYSVEELINKMIIDSDNGAKVLLLSNINQSSLDAIYNILNIENPENVSGNFTISPRTTHYFLEYSTVQHILVKLFQKGLYQYFQKLPLKMVLWLGFQAVQLWLTNLENMSL